MQRFYRSSPPSTHPLPTLLPQDERALLKEARIPRHLHLLPFHALYPDTPPLLTLLTSHASWTSFVPQEDDKKKRAVLKEARIAFLEEEVPALVARNTPYGVWGHGRVLCLVVGCGLRLALGV